MGCVKSSRSDATPLHANTSLNSKAPNSVEHQAVLLNDEGRGRLKPAREHSIDSFFRGLRIQRGDGTQAQNSVVASKSPSLKRYHAGDLLPNMASFASAGLRAVKAAGARAAAAEVARKARRFTDVSFNTLSSLTDV
jgi:hypothetical protein